MTLYTTYRPTCFDDMYGNERTIETLESLLKQKPRPHSYLFQGPTGCGKTTLGRIMARELDCSGMDYIELNSADFRGIGTIRSIRRRVQFKPLESNNLVWLFDEASQLSDSAQHALLKVLEEPPSWVYFILCTTKPKKLLQTIRGRCSTFAVSPLTQKQMRGLLRRVVRAEGKSMPVEVYNEIARLSRGQPREALTLLEQVLAVPASKQLEAARGTDPRSLF